MSQDLPSSHKDGSGMMGVECCLALGSSSLRNPDHSREDPGRWAVREKEEQEIWDILWTALEFSAFLFLLYPLSGFASCFQIWILVHNETFVT